MLRNLKKHHLRCRFLRWTPPAIIRILESVAPMTSENSLNASKKAMEERIWRNESSPPSGYLTVLTSKCFTESILTWRSLKGESTYPPPDPFPLYSTVAQTSVKGWQKSSRVTMIAARSYSENGTTSSTICASTQAKSLLNALLRDASWSLIRYPTRRSIWMCTRTRQC